MDGEQYERIPTRWWIKEWIEHMSRPFAQFQARRIEQRFLRKLRGE